MRRRYRARGGVAQCITRPARLADHRRFSAFCGAEDLPPGYPAIRRGRPCSTSTSRSPHRARASSCSATRPAARWARCPSGSCSQATCQSPASASPPSWTEHPKRLAAALAAVLDRLVDGSLVVDTALGEGLGSAAAFHDALAGGYAGASRSSTSDDPRGQRQRSGSPSPRIPLTRAPARPRGAQRSARIDPDCGGASPASTSRQAAATASGPVARVTSNQPAA